ncbi:MAG: MEDS domain-containing protein [Nitrosotalea sp.]
MLELKVTPQEYVEKLSTNKHMMLVYDDEKYGKEVQLLFIKKGLEKGECCIYLVHHEERFTISEMTSYGIDAEEQIKKGTLHIIDTDNFTDRMQGMAELQKMCSAGPQVRIVGRWIPCIDTVEGISSELDAEKELHKSFHNFPGSVLCTYPVDKICKKDQAQRTIELMNAHQTVILLTEYGKGTIHEF